MLRVSHTLTVEGKEVGYRVRVTINTKIKGVFDISKDDVELLIEDFNVPFITSNIKGSIQLVPKGSQLVPLDEENVSELDYSKYLVMAGHERFSKTDTELKKLYNHYNKVCFSNSLPKDVPVEWSTRMTSGAGLCSHRLNRDTGKYEFVIRLSVPYHQRFEDEVLDTLVHEMIHVKHPKEHHGRMFHFEKDRINREHGFNITVRSTGRATVNYVYACENCEKEYETAKRIDVTRYRCGKKSCRGDLYLKEDLTDDLFDNTDWGAGTEW